MISNAADGLLVFDIDTQSFWFKDDTEWVELVSGNITKLEDDDMDTRVQLKEGITSDSISIEVDNTEMITMRVTDEGYKLFEVGQSGVNFSTQFGKRSWGKSNWTPVQ